MKKNTLFSSVLFGIAIAMGLSIIILTFFMEMTCAYNLRAFFTLLSVAVICLSLAGINILRK